jgi:hypothetical protein
MAPLEVDAAIDDQSCQDNEKHNRGCERPPVVFGAPWVGATDCSAELQGLDISWVSNVLTFYRVPPGRHPKKSPAKDDSGDFMRKAECEGRIQAALRPVAEETRSLRKTHTVEKYVAV